MKNFVTTLLILTAWLLFASTSVADTDTEALERRLSRELAPDIDRIAPSPIEGLYEVTLGGRVVYVSKDGRYLLSGRLIELETREDLTERVLAKQRLKMLAGVSEKQMIIFEPEGEVKHTLTTFTDIDCPYCRRMHSEMDQLNRLGIRVRYMLFPRAGVPSTSYEKAVSVWCATDQRAEMTRAKTGVIPERRTCENPVKEHMRLANRLGLSGTPFTITDTGRVITGYRPAPALYATLEADKQQPR